jgi:hypothetical protein
LEEMMLYRRNVGTTERWLRLLAGGLIAGCGLMLLGTSVGGLVVAASGLFTSATGAFGFCPACAAVRRNLPATPASRHNGER